ncbi:MAG TPA: sugar phosphate isomerase/epimerase, partial [Burkholderiaceae bacterium]|nr:sugar phosphate isomerase/epimerase [Burkholderiaceae bacterium]
QEAAVACLQELAEDAHDGVSIAVEGPFGYEQVRDLLTSIDRPQVKFCYDTGDAAAARHDSIGMVRNLGADRIAQVHFKDVNLSVQPPDFAVRLGRGDVRFDAVMFALRSVMYDGWVVLETPPGDKDGQIVALHAEDARGILARGQDKESQEGSAVEHAAS